MTKRITTVAVALAAVLIGCAQARAGVSAELNVWGEAGSLPPISQQSFVDGSNGVADVSFGWPADAPPSTACPATGCAARSVGALASVDEAAGVLRAGGAASLLLGNPQSQFEGADASVRSATHVDDAITLSKAATVWIEGTVHGTVSSHVNDRNQLADPRASMTVKLDFCCTRGFEGPVPIGGYEEVFEPEANAGPTPIDETFSIAVDLPAGRTFFTGSLLADASLLIDGVPGLVLEQDALLDLADTVTFHVRVPDDVVATSDSGLLPIVGGAAVSDTTAPVSTAAIVDAPNEAGWNNGPTRVHVTAVDGSDGSGVASITVALAGAQSSLPATTSGAVADVDVTAEGTTTVTYFATDAAGNVETPHQLTVRIDRTPPTVTYTGNAGTYAVDEQVTIGCVAADDVSGVATTTCANVDAPAYTLGVGAHTLTATATDRAGNTGSGTAELVVTVDPGGLARLLLGLAPGSPQARAVASVAEAGNETAFVRVFDATVARLARLGELTADEAASLLRLASSL